MEISLDKMKFYAAWKQYVGIINMMYVIKLNELTNSAAVVCCSPRVLRHLQIE